MLLYPGLHSQMNEPYVSIHSKFSDVKQWCMSVVHSLISEQRETVHDYNIITGAIKSHTGTRSWIRFIDFEPTVTTAVI